MAHMEDGEMKNKGLCLQCARKLNIPQVKEVMDKMGLTDEELESMSKQLGEWLGGEGSELDGDFELGGAQALPFLQNWMGAGGEAPEKTDAESGDQLPTIHSSEMPEEVRHSRAKDREKNKRDTRRKRKFLENFCENLTDKAKEGRIDRIVGREREIYRVIQILNRRTKNNPCLIGEPGVGKTAIAEGLAQRIAAGDVPAQACMDKELHLLDLTALVAGTQFRGQFESRIKGLIDEVKEAGQHHPVY